MGRKKNPEEFLQRHLRIPKKLDDPVATEGTKLGLSYNDVVIKLLWKGLKERVAKYRGFVEKIMSHDFTCFHCGRKFQAGKLAMYDAETGAASCIECAIRNKMTTKDRVKLLIMNLELKEDNRALKVERVKNAEEYRKDYIKQSSNIAEVTQYKKDEETTVSQIDDLMRKVLKLSQITNRTEEKELLDELARLKPEITSFLFDHKAERERILKERQRLLEERKKVLQKRKKKEESYAT